MTGAGYICGMTKPEEKLTVAEWQRRYLAPLIYIHQGLAEPSDALQSGFAGFVLDGILAVKEIDGEEANDWECVEMVADLIQYAQKLEERF